MSLPGDCSHPGSHPPTPYLGRAKPRLIKRPQIRKRWRWQPTIRYFRYLCTRPGHVLNLNTKAGTGMAGWRRGMASRSLSCLCAKFMGEQHLLRASDKEKCKLHINDVVTLSLCPSSHPLTSPLEYDFCARSARAEAARSRRKQLIAAPIQYRMVISRIRPRIRRHA